MLGRLLQFGSGGGASASSQPQDNIASRPISSLESVQEDAHTRNLLFPDPQLLFQNRNDQVFPLSATPLTPGTGGNPGAYDSSDDLDLDVRDVRVLIMQDTLGSSNATLLFDSHPAPVPSPNPQRNPGSGNDTRRTPATSRKGSIGQPSRPLTIHAEPSQGRQGAFDRRGSTHTRTFSSFETDSQKQAREYRDELSTFASCVFGNSELMSYKGTSTKVHVVPVGPQASEQPSASVIGDGRTSIGRSSVRSSKLSQSFTSQNVSPNTAPPMLSNSVGKKKILITRLFPVNLTQEDIDASATPQNRFSDENSSYPFPTGTEEPKKKGPQKQRRTPMYAVVLVVQLPNSRGASTAATPKSLFRESGSYTEQDVFSSSYSSARPSMWALVGSGAYGEATDSSFSVDVEDRIDSLTQHWDIIIRTLTHLQQNIATTLRGMLKQADVASPEPFAPSVPPSVAPPRGQGIPGRRSGEIPRPKPSKGTTKLVALPSDSLAADVNIAAEVNIARRRVVTGLKASRVVTGQGRWGIWRDEAIWTSRWAKSLGQEEFLFKLMTGFLSTHTDWLQALAPPSIRRRLANTRRQTPEREDLSLPARTIVVSEDKMAARRMIFLLSAFLPASQQYPGSRAHRPSTSASVSAFAHSPPTFVVPVLREESLRRKINRRSNRRTSHSQNPSQSMRASAIPANLSNEQGHERRFSDAGCIRPTSLAMPNNELASRKSSAATTATVMPETTTAHFSSVQRVDSHRRARPQSSGSLATDDLKRSLQRGDSSGHTSNPSTDSRNQGSRWGSVISGLWSPRRRDSTSTSSPGQPGDMKSPTRPEPPKRDKLSQMVEEAVEMDQDQDRSMPRSSLNDTSQARDVTTPREQTSKPRPSFSQPGRTPDPSGAFESPVKTSINEEDGVIDVDFPFPDYIASFESAISSPSSSGYLSTPGLTSGLDSFEQLIRTTTDGEPPLNAAGWLSGFHPDFSLQAIPPQDNLIDDVKATLRAEPTPGSLTLNEDDPGEKWVDVGSVVIADATTNTVRRLLYRRLVRPRQAAERPIGSSTQVTTQSGVQHTPSILPYEIQLEDDFVEEIVSQADDALTEALEKVMKFRHQGSTESPLSRSVTREDVESDQTPPETANKNSSLHTPTLDMPRVQAKTTVLSALEDIIRDVVDHRDRAPNDRVNPAGGRYQESSLQQAVRNWAFSVDE